MSASFHEIRFPVMYDWGTESTPEFNTNIDILPSGSESRNSIWVTGRKNWRLDSTGLSTSEKLTSESFYRARNGNIFGFRLRDNEWYQCINEPLPLVSSTTAQLQFVYQDAINPQTQIIRKPVLTANIQPDPTQELYSPDITLQRSTGGAFSAFSSSNWTIDRTTGIITFTSSQAGNNFIWSGSYDWPVRFESAKTMWKRQFIEDYEWTGISILELINEW